MKHLIAITLALALSPAWADSSNGDMSDRGGDIVTDSVQCVDTSTASFLEHFTPGMYFGPLCGSIPAAPEFPTIIPPLVPTPPIPEPSSWLLLLVGLLVLALKGKT